MDDLTRADFNALSALLMRRKKRVRITPLWQMLHNELSVGDCSADGRNMNFSAADREALRKAVVRKTGFDPLAGKLPNANSSDRVEMAGKVNNEKLAYKAVGSERVLITATHQRLNINGVECSVPAETGLWVDWRSVALGVEQKLVVVENEAAFIYWHRFNLPVELENAVVVYRGHDHSAKAVKNWLQQKPRQQLVGAYDFDPAGLAMAHQQKVCFLLIPEQPDRFLLQADALFNKPEAFAAQHGYHDSNRMWVSGETEDAWRWMDKHGTSITQEAMANSAVPMRLISI